MITILKLDTTLPEHVERFVALPYRLYAADPYWLPPNREDMACYLNRARHPFYEHGDADFYLAVQDGQDVGRVAVLANHPGYELMQVPHARFYLFESENDPEIATALFDAATMWAGEHGYHALVGPLGFTIFDIVSLLVDGFTEAQRTTLSTYNFAYYDALLAQAGFQPAREDVASYHLPLQQYNLPAWVNELADSVRRKHQLTVKNFATQEDITRVGPVLLETITHGFGTPMARSESVFLIEQIRKYVDSRLIQVICRLGEEGDDGPIRLEDIVAFTLTLPDLSTVLKANAGNASPATLRNAMAETTGIIFYAIYIEPAYQVLGLAALLFSEVQRLAQATQYENAYFIHVYGTDKRMAHDMAVINAVPIQSHRLYVRMLHG